MDDDDDDLIIDRVIVDHKTPAIKRSKKGVNLSFYFLAGD